MQTIPKLKRKLMGACLTLSLLLAVGAQADTEGIMRQLKSLEGEWLLVDEQGVVLNQVGSAFRLTANGSTLSELMFPGNDHEMLNVFHADGDRVLMTHYCGAGNQPRLEVVRAEQGNRLLLNFDSITNLPSPDAPFMHHAEYEWDGEDRLTTTWYDIEDGEISDAVTVIRLARKTN